MFSLNLIIIIKYFSVWISSIETHLFKFLRTSKIKMMHNDSAYVHVWEAT